MIGDVNYMNISKSDFGVRLMKLRKSKNLSMQGLADIIGVSGKSTINEWEKGRGLPKKATMDRLSTVLNTSSDYLYYGDLKDVLENKVLKIINNYGYKSNVTFKKLIDVTNGDFHPDDVIVRHITKLKDHVLRDDESSVEDRIFKEIYPGLFQIFTSKGVNYETNLEEIDRISNPYFQKIYVDQVLSFEGQAMDVLHELEKRSTHTKNTKWTQKSFDEVAKKFVKDGTLNWDGTDYQIDSMKQLVQQYYRDKLNDKLVETRLSIKSLLSEENQIEKRYLK
ncbi:helix-turn-helix domain-containing protein [Companilactobacillus kimchii]|uniref:HTH cro/C1-type domain-containing protein n=2 Tax=Companilactobacillus kimchii TaxID=2801452 RepID=A0ABR5NSA6_9LACO|nr:hypothetical protein FC97_GL001264 [Companilactobacillus kimchii DSM 13961 = JCM 10707]OWF33675.1 hypothetical protein LKACC12383_00815 [Companilactobacillus kimchii]